MTTIPVGKPVNIAQLQPGNSAAHFASTLKALVARRCQAVIRGLFSPVLYRKQIPAAFSRGTHLCRQRVREIFHWQGLRRSGPSGGGCAAFDEIVNGFCGNSHRTSDTNDSDLPTVPDHLPDQLGADGEQLGHFGYPVKPLGPIHDLLPAHRVARP
jgi:hypothetical protein